MKTFGIVFVLAGLVASPAISPAAEAARAENKKLLIEQTCEPLIRPSIGEVLPAYGQVRLLINVDETGKLADSMLLDFTDARYSDAVVEAVKRWRFTPAVYQGTRIGTRMTLVFGFETRGQVVSMTCLDMYDAFFKSSFGRDSTVRCVVPGKELDAAPVALVSVSPLAIRPDLAGSSKGVWVDFYIDETGRPRMAAVDVKDNDAMAMASLQAIEQWRFTPPTSKGKPVAVRAGQWFDFSKSLVASK